MSRQRGSQAACWTEGHCAQQCERRPLSRGCGSNQNRGWTSRKGLASQGWVRAVTFCQAELPLGPGWAGALGLPGKADGSLNARLPGGHGHCTERGGRESPRLCGLGPAVPGGRVKLLVNPLRAGCQEDGALHQEPAPLDVRPRIPGASLQEFFILLFSRPRCVCVPPRVPVYRNTGLPALGSGAALAPRLQRKWCPPLLALAFPALPRQLGLAVIMLQSWGEWPHTPACP